MGRRKKILELSKEYKATFKYKVECIIGENTITSYTDFSPVLFIRKLNTYSEFKNAIPNQIIFYDNSNNNMIEICLLNEKTYHEKGDINYLAFRHYKDINP
jgi:hypothetical protein